MPLRKVEVKVLHLTVPKVGEVLGISWSHGLSNKQKIHAAGAPKPALQVDMIWSDTQLKL